MTLEQSFNLSRGAQEQASTTRTADLLQDILLSMLTVLIALYIRSFLENLMNYFMPVSRKTQLFIQACVISFIVLLTILLKTM